MNSTYLYFLSFIPQEFTIDLVVAHPQIANFIYFDSNIRRELIERNAEIIKYLDEPTIGEYKFALGLNPENIKYIENPDEELQRFAIRQSSNGIAIKFIKNPTEKIIRYAVAWSGGIASRFIKNKSQDIQDYVKITCFSNPISYKYS